MIVLFAVLLLYGLIGMEWRRAMIFIIVTGTLLFAMTLPMVLTMMRFATAFSELSNLLVLLIGCELLAVGCFLAGAGLRKVVTLATHGVAERS